MRGALGSEFLQSPRPHWASTMGLCRLGRVDPQTGLSQQASRATHVVVKRIPSAALVGASDQQPFDRALGASSAVGLLSAPVGDGGYDAVSWAGLGLPLAVAARRLRRR